MRQQQVRPDVRRRASAYSLGPPDIRLPGRVDARTLSLVLGVLAALGLLGATLSFVVDLFVAPWRIYSADAEESLHLLASAIGLTAAFRLARGAHRARHLVLAGLALNAVATLVFGASTLPRVETI